MIEAGEWVRCDAALDTPTRRAADIAALGDVRNLRRCEKHLAFLDGHRQRGWATARERGWALVRDSRYGGLARNVCPRHAHTPAAQLVLMPLRGREQHLTEDIALALADSVQSGQQLLAELQRSRVDAEQAVGEYSACLVDVVGRVSPLDDAERAARSERYERLRRQQEQEQR